VERLEALETALSEDRFAALDRREAPLADRAEMLRCHPESYVARIEAAIPTEGSRALDGDTHVTPGSWAAALRAVGAVGAAVDAVVASEVANAFCATRPPGHHAETETPMGFCLFGTAAIAAKRALDHHGLKRVAVVDFDVHHGNGTQDLLWNEARTLFVGSHQMPLWPGTGDSHETGAHGNVMNLPLPPGTDGAGFRRTWERHGLPALDAFAPELIVISAGFDAHADDPLAQLALREADFAWITEALCDLAEAHAGGRVVSTLEGGYDLRALAASAAAHVDVLMKRGQA
jgi:acetoin utilization deacetylase AcuC-like enzyme